MSVQVERRIGGELAPKHLDEPADGGGETP